jgi:hypothetical protein
MLRQPKQLLHADVQGGCASRLVIDGVTNARGHHFVVTSGSTSSTEAVSCESQNDSNGGFDDDQNHKIAFSAPDKVIGESFSVIGTVEQ